MEYQVVAVDGKDFPDEHNGRPGCLDFMDADSYGVLRRGQRSARSGKEGATLWKVYIARQDGVEIGVCVTLSSPRKVPIVYTRVMPSHRGKGVGASLIRMIQEEAVEKGQVISVELPTCVSEARSFYCQQAHFEPSVYTEDGMRSTPLEEACHLGWNKKYPLALSGNNRSVVPTIRPPTWASASGTEGGSAGEEDRPVRHDPTTTTKRKLQHEQPHSAEDEQNDSQ